MDKIRQIIENILLNEVEIVICIKEFTDRLILS